MKKLALLCAAALFLTACHCERKTTGTPCRKGTCQTQLQSQRDAEAARRAAEARRRAEAERRAVPRKKEPPRRNAIMRKSAAPNAAGTLLPWNMKNPFSSAITATR